MEKVYNFSAGPAMIPQEVLKKAQAEMLNYNNSGMSVMELSHRGKDFTHILNKAEELLRELMQIPDNYKVLFVQGGASAQFGMIPMNFSKNKKADYIDTGIWSKKAIAEAEKTMKVSVLLSGKSNNYTAIPDISNLKIQPEADFLHITTNNTIAGTQYHHLPKSIEVPIIADMSSDILSKHYQVSDFGMIYAGAQKNIGPSGFAVSIIRQDLLERCSESIPNIFNYKKIADNGSMYNTPPTYGIYICKLVLEWLKKQGGVSAISEINNQKAALMYDFLDNSQLFRSPVSVESRSKMNIPFTTDSDELDSLFIQEASARGLMQLKGHRTVGGMRASIYNAMPIEGVEALLSFMKKFERNNATH